MTGQMIDEYAKQVEDFAFLPIRKPGLFSGGVGGDKNAPGLRVGIAISGWLTDEAEVLVARRGGASNLPGAVRLLLAPQSPLCGLGSSGECNAAVLLA